MDLKEDKLVASLLREARYAELEKYMASVDLRGLAASWGRFSALDKLVLFKLFDAARALDFYACLPFKEKYFLLCGFPLSAIAPVLEKLKPSQRLLFVQLPRDFYDRMFRELVSERVEMTVSLRNN